MWTALEKEQLVGAHLRVRKWRHAGSEVLSAAASVHHAIEVCWVDDGAAHYTLGSKRLEVHAGEVMVVPAGVEHATAFAGATVAGSLWLDARAFMEIADAAGMKSRLEPGAIADARALISVAQLLQAEAFEGGAGALMAADALAEVLALKLVRATRCASGRGATAPGIRRALDEIEGRYSESLTVEQLAHSAAMSRYHFSRRFQEQVGESPYAYLQGIRLSRAAELLRGGRTPVTEAAYSCGFTDLGRFGRKFKQRFGCAPSAFAHRS
jgi:AraC-like DNA-binding protein